MRRQIPRCLMGIFFCMVFLGLMRSSCAADPIAYYKNGTEWHGSSDIKGSTESFENNDLTVSIIAKGGETRNDIYGIYNETDNKVLLSNNQVTIETFNSNYSLHYLCGAYSTGNDCKISSNSVTVTVNNDSMLSLNSIYGAYSNADYCNISSNTVTVNNATINNNPGTENNNLDTGLSVSGAYIKNCGEASYNTVNLYNSQINALNRGDDILIGAYIGDENSSQEYSNATHNTINITNSTGYQIIGAIVKSYTPRANANFF